MEHVKSSKTGFRYTKYAKIVAAMARDLSVNASDLEDLIQETLAQVVAEFDPARGKRFTNFLRMVAHARIVDFIRGCKKAMPSLDARERVVAKDKDEALAGAGEGPVTVAVRGGDLARVERAVAGLAAADQRVVSLKYVDGLSYEEIAAKQGMGVHEVRIAIERARRELKRNLAIYFSSRMTSRAELQALFDAIDTLPSLYKDAFKLRHIEGLSEAQVAAKLAKSESAGIEEKVVRARLEKAYSHIKVKAGAAKWQKIKGMLGV